MQMECIFNMDLTREYKPDYAVEANNYVIQNVISGDDEPLRGWLHGHSFYFEMNKSYFFDSSMIDYIKTSRIKEPLDTEFKQRYKLIPTNIKPLN
jgi:hypothetical protein